MKADELDGLTLEHFLQTRGDELKNQINFELRNWMILLSHMHPKYSNGNQNQNELVSPLQMKQRNIEDIQKWFWGAFRKSITSLTLVDCYSTSRFTVFDKIFFDSLPSLQILRIIDFGISQHAWGHLDPKIQKFDLPEPVEYSTSTLKQLYIEAAWTKHEYYYMLKKLVKYFTCLETFSFKFWSQGNLRSGAPAKIHTSSWIYDSIIFWHGIESLKILKISQQNNAFKTILKFSIIKTNNKDLKVEWQRMRCSFYKFNEFPTKCIRNQITELILVGQIFQNLCFLKDLENLKKLVWYKSNKNEQTSEYSLRWYQCKKIIKQNRIGTTYIALNKCITFQNCICK